MPETISAKTPHLFMWFTDGGKLPDDTLPLPNNPPLDYLSRLKEECSKLRQNNTPVYLAYCGRMITEAQKQKMENLAYQPGFENLIVIDYDKVEERIDNNDVIGSIAVENYAEEKMELKDEVATQSRIKEVVAECVDSWKNDFQNQYRRSKPLVIQSTIDSTRLVLLYFSDLVKDVARDKYQEESKKPYLDNQLGGILYRDFDVTLKTNVPDIVTSNGCISSLNCEEVFFEWLKGFSGDMGELAKGFAESFLFDTHIYSEIVQDLYDLSRNKDIPENRMNRLNNIESNLRYICQSQNPEQHSLFSELFIKPVVVENSLIAFNEDRHPVAASLIVEVFRKKNLSTNNFFVEDPYVSVKRWTRADKGIAENEEVLSNSEIINAGFETIIKNLKALEGYKIGNDLTWDKNFDKAQSSQQLRNALSRPISSASLQTPKSKENFL